MNIEELKKKNKQLYNDVRNCDFNSVSQLRELLYRFVDYHETLLKTLETNQNK